MIVYLYRWKLKPGKEEEFKTAWAYVTQELREKCGSKGSRLHRGNDGLYYGYAQWPSSEVRESAKLKHEAIDKARATMIDATQEAFPEIVLDPVSDFLI